MKLPEKCLSPKDVQYSFRDVYDKKEIENVENLAIQDGKIVTVHGSKDAYNLLQINAFGHMLPLKDNAVTILYKADEKYGYLLMQIALECTRTVALSKNINLTTSIFQVW